MILCIDSRKYANYGEGQRICLVVGKAGLSSSETKCQVASGTGSPPPHQPKNVIFRLDFLPFLSHRVPYPRVNKKAKKTDSLFTTRRISSFVSEAVQGDDIFHNSDMLFRSHIPICKFQTLDSFEMPYIICYEGQIMGHGARGDDQIKVVQSGSRFF